MRWLNDMSDHIRHWNAPSARGVLGDVFPRAAQSLRPRLYWTAASPL